MTFEVKLQAFSGPLQLLLELIEQKEMPITEVSLAQVTDGYLQYVNTHEVPPEELADFLVVASKLLLLKSRAILPDPEPVEEEVDPSLLAEQLRLYKAFVDVSAHIDERFSGATRMFARRTMAIEPKTEYQMPENAGPERLRGAFAALLKCLSPFFSLRQASLERVVSVNERLEQIRGAVLQRSRMTFRDVLQGSKSKSDVVVSFLALLELVKQKTVNTIQGDTFSDIVIKHVE